MDDMLSALLSMLGDDEDGKEKDQGGASPNFSMPDPETLGKIMTVMTELSKENDDTKLLYALRPYLRPERQSKVDEAATICRLLALLPKLMEGEK